MLSLAIFISFIDIKLIYKYAYIIFFLSFLLLLSVELIGVFGKGATRWINIFGFSLQPSELIKITIILALARYYHDIKFEDIPELSIDYKLSNYTAVKGCNSKQAANLNQSKIVNYVCSIYATAPFITT